MNALSSVSKETSVLRDYFHGSKVLITGGFGFVGSNMAKTLIEFGADITLLDLRTGEDVGSLINTLGLRDKVRIVQGDVGDLTLVRQLVHESGFRFIFNFAAYATVIEKAVEAPYDTVMANTMGWVNVMEAARTAPVKAEVVFLSSTDKVYGEMDGHAYQEDTTPLRGIGVYDAAKLAADVLGKTYFEVFGLPTVVLRMCNLFGPGDFNTEYRLIPKAMRNLLASDTPVARSSTSIRSTTSATTCTSKTPCGRSSSWPTTRVVAATSSTCGPPNTPRRRTCSRRWCTSPPMWNANTIRDGRNRSSTTGSRSRSAKRNPR